MEGGLRITRDEFELEKCGEGPGAGYGEAGLEGHIGEEAVEVEEAEASGGGEEEGPKEPGGEWGCGTWWRRWKRRNHGAAKATEKVSK